MGQAGEDDETLVSSFRFPVSSGHLLFRLWRLWLLQCSSCFFRVPTTRLTFQIRLVCFHCLIKLPQSVERFRHFEGRLWFTRLRIEGMAKSEHGTSIILLSEVVAPDLHVLRKLAVFDRDSGRRIPGRRRPTRVHGNVNAIGLRTIECTFYDGS